MGETPVVDPAVSAADLVSGTCLDLDMDAPLTAHSLPVALVYALTAPTVIATLKDALGGIVSDIRRELREKDVKIHELESEVKALKTKMKSLENSTDDNEQYSRRNSVRVFTKIQESPGEDTDRIILQLAETVGADITKQDICRSHRVNRILPDKIRPILVKFTNHRAKERLLSLRKETGAYITEDLTKKRADIMYKARLLCKKGTFKSVWSRDGLIKIRLQDDTVRTVTTTQGLDALS